MNADDTLRQHVLELLRRTTERGFDEAVKDFPPEFMNTRPPNVDYTPWHLLEHLRIGQSDILQYIRDPQYKSPHWPNEYWPPKEYEADAARWNRSIEAFRADRAALIDLVADSKTDLLVPIPHTPGHTVLREAFLNAGHTAGHLGEFSILREVMKTWRST